MRLPFGGSVMPRRNLPDNQPPRNGLQGITPRPSRRATGTNSHSVERHKRLYCGWRQTNLSHPDSRLRSIARCNRASPRSYSHRDNEQRLLYELIQGRESLPKGSSGPSSEPERGQCSRSEAAGGSLQQRPDMLTTESHVIRRPHWNRT
jgi:hypothetical protein